MENLVDYEHHGSTFVDPIEVYHEVLSRLRVATAAAEMQVFLDVL
jgi:hypothetical protein